MHTISAQGKAAACGQDGRDSESPSALAAELVAAGKLTTDALEQARARAKATGERLAVAISALNLASEEDIAQAQAIVHGLELVAPDEYPDLPLFEEQVQPRFLRQSRILPLRCDTDQIVVAACDPGDKENLEALRVSLEQPISVRVALPKDMEAAFKRLYGGSAFAGQSPQGAVFDEPARPPSPAQPSEILEVRANEATVVRIANGLISDAIETGADEIHLELSGEHLHVRYRVNGALKEVPSPARTNQEAMAARLKRMAGMAITREHTQRGKLQVAFRGRPTDIRITAVPTALGEAMTVRLADRNVPVRELDELSISKPARVAIDELLRKPSGLILIAEPGRGRCNQLGLALLKNLKSNARKIVAVDDFATPLIEGIIQIEANDASGPAHSGALRSAIDLCPDVLSAGRIESPDVASLAVEAALNERLVLARLAAGSAAAATLRLVRLGVPSTLVADGLNGVIAARQVHQLCRHCRAPFQASRETLERLARYRSTEDGPVQLHGPRGCKICSESGYDGHILLTEVMQSTPDLRRLIDDGAPERTIEDTAVTNGTIRLTQEGFARAAAGEVTLEDVLQATRA